MADMLTIDEEVEYGVFNLDRTPDALFTYFGLRTANKILTKFLEFVDEFDEHGYQDSFRIRIVKDGERMFDNAEWYQDLITCCGSCDKQFTLDFLPNYVLEFGCNFGH
jgi:hypothetical protein